MKRLLFFTVFAVLSAAFISCDGEQVINEQDLPVNAQNFVKQHFPECMVIYAEKDKDGITLYDVKLNCNVDIEFDKKGDWTEVDCESDTVPDAIIPAKILEYVKSIPAYQNSYIDKIDRKTRNSYEVELNTELDLIFNKDFKFVRIDD